MLEVLLSAIPRLRQTASLDITSIKKYHSFAAWHCEEVRLPIANTESV